jgi:DNA-binding MarR family transcriptional regulator
MDEMNHELYEKITRFQWLWHKQRTRGHAAGGPMADPTRGQGRILALLKMQDGVSTKDLSYLLGIRVSSLNELLAKLEKGGYAVREPSEADKRVMLVKLTEKGKDEKRQETDTADIFGCLSGEEQETLGEYLDRVIAALEAEVGDGPDGEFERLRAAREHMGNEIFERFASVMRGKHPFHDGHGPVFRS